jgi:chemotaxis protein MotA
MMLFQPVEWLIIFGCAGGALVIANPPPVVKATLAYFPVMISKKGLSKSDYLAVLMLFNRLFTKMRRDGLLAIEADIDDPEKSELFSADKSVLHHHALIEFICDNLKIILSLNPQAHELETLMENEIEALHHDHMHISHAVYRVADMMPGLGIVAAVLGIVLTMGKIDQPATVIGHHIAVALLGTFMGIFCSYAVFGPMSAFIESQANEETLLLNMAKGALISFTTSSSPMLALEYARRIIPEEHKPSFTELEKARSENKK